MAYEVRVPLFLGVDQLLLSLQTVSRMRPVMDKQQEVAP